MDSSTHAPPYTETGPVDVSDAFFAAAARHPHRVAVRHDGTDLTYAGLADLVRDLAGRLGADPAAVAVSLPRSSDAIVALLGVLASGGTYCPVDQSFPAERQSALISAGGCRFVVDEGGLRAVPASDRAHDPALTHGDPAYVLFTSGSTGGPKPVMTSRTAISTAAAALRELFEITPDDRVLQFASLNWDTCFEEILPTLTAGATLVIDQLSHLGSVAALLRMVEDEGVTVLNLPTAYWHVLVASLAEAGGALPDSVRLVVTGGEAVNPTRLADWQALDTTKVRLLNTYGCTETTLITHTAELSGLPATDRVPIGHPLPHVLEHVTDEGELLIAGPSVALGYRGLAATTEERFRLHNFGTGPRRWFHTGDRVSRLPDGGLVYLGRLDNELKIRGVRVDPAEVELEIARHPGVAAVAVAGVTIGDHTTLAAYVVPGPRADKATLAADVLVLLRSRLPQHLVPSRISVVPDLVHTVSGKVDRAASHERHSERAADAQLAPLSVEDVSAIFRRILEDEDVTADSDFFDAGGDSLLATRVLSVIARASGVELSFDDFAGASSPAALAQLMSTPA